MTESRETFLDFWQGALENCCKRIPTYAPCDTAFKALKQEVGRYLGGGVRRESSPTDWK